MAAGRVREGVVGVVYLLELLGAGAALGGVRGDAVGVVPQGGFLVAFADLGLGCCWGDVEGGVEVWWGFGLGWVGSWSEVVGMDERGGGEISLVILSVLIRTGGRLLELVSSWKERVGLIG